MAMIAYIKPAIDHVEYQRVRRIKYYYSLGLRLTNQHESARHEKHLVGHVIRTA